MLSRMVRVALSATCLVAALATVVDPPAIRAAEPGPLADKVAASLGFVPENVSFYSTSLRIREQLDIFLASNVWARFKALPAVQQVWKQAEKQWKSDSMATVTQLLSLPENEELLSLLGDLASHEMFVYGDEQFLTLIDLLNEINIASRESTLLTAIQAANGEVDEDSSMAQTRAMLDTLADNLDSLSLPALVMGLKTEDMPAAKRQLKRLEVMARIVLAQAPPQLASFGRAKQGDGDYLTLTLDGSLVPWDDYDLDQFAEEQDQYDALVRKLKSLKLAISIGVYKNFVIISLAKSEEHLAALGASELLARSGHLDPVAAASDQRLTSVTYVSEAMMGRLKGRPQDWDFLNDLAEDVVEELELEDDDKQAMLKDVAGLTDDLKQLMPQAGPMVEFSYLTPRGVESYMYDHSQSLTLDSSRPLDLLDHLGGMPLAAAVARGKVSVEKYKMLVKWLKVGWGYFEKFAVPKMPPQNREQFMAVWTEAKPLLSRANSTTIEKLLPALADGQMALVLDARWQSKQWIGAAPETPEPMTLPELALVLGVTDAKLLKSALTDYRSIADGAIELYHKFAPNDQAPDFTLPRPTKKSTPAGDVYAYTLPDEAGVDPQVVPNLGIGEHVAVASLSLEHSGRILAATPFPGAGALADPKQPLASAMLWNWSASVEKATPWIELAVANYAPVAVAAINARANPDADAPPNVDLKEALPQIREGLHLLGALKTITSSLRIDPHTGVMIRHSELHFEDVP